TVEPMLESHAGSPEPPSGAAQSQAAALAQIEDGKPARLRHIALQLRSLQRGKQVVMQNRRLTYAEHAEFGQRLPGHVGAIADSKYTAVRRGIQLHADVQAAPGIRRQAELARERMGL